MKNRQKALSWWKSLSNEDKLIKAIKIRQLHGRTIQSLTGSEIESIFRANLFNL